MKYLVKDYRACILFICLFLSPAYLFAENRSANISVKGDAVVYVEPDEVVIELGIQTRNEGVLLAQKENKEIHSRVIEVALNNGVLKKNLKTEHLNIEPRWDNNYKHEKFLGYWVRNSISIILTDLEKYEVLMTSLLKAGVTHIHHVEFRTTEFKKHRERAREMAVEAAREKAEKMADTLGYRVLRPTSLHESGFNSVYNSGRWGRSGGYGAYQNSVQVLSGSMGADLHSITLGKIGIHGSVSAGFEVEYLGDG
ncbi:MAG: SIMPL domain-containing protein [Opitutales bacterium]